MTTAYNKNTTVDELVSNYAPVIQSKIILTTGVSPRGLGATFVEAIAAAKPGLLILAGRNASKIQQTAEAIAAKNPDVKTRNLVVDLCSMKSVRKAAEEVNGWADVPKIDVMMNNAAIMATEFQLTEDGFESQLAASHIGHFLLTNLLMDKILAADAPRVVNVSSSGHRAGGIRLGDPHFSNGKAYNKWRAYGQAKTANMLFALSLAEKLGKRGLLAYSLHPGAIFGTSLGTHLNLTMEENSDLMGLVEMDQLCGDPWGWKDISGSAVNIAQGTATHAFAAFEPSLKDHNGVFLMESQVADPYTMTVRPWGTSPVEAELLWQLTEDMIGEKFSY